MRYLSGSFLFKWIIRSACLVTFIGAVMGCQVDFSFKIPKDTTGSGVEKITKSGAEFSLAWEDDSGDAICYKVFWRVHDTLGWESLATGVASPSLVVTSSRLPYGEYEFAVCSVASDGTESLLHTSLDADADPVSGWYIEWMP